MAINRIGHAMDPQRLRHHLTERLSFLEEYLSVSESLWMSLSLREMDEVAQWMTRREELIGNIDQLDGDLRERWPEDSSPDIEGAGEVREGLQHLYKRIEEVLQTVKTIDEKCEGRIASLKAEVRAELEKLCQGRMMVRNYTKSQHQPPTLIDVRR